VSAFADVESLELQRIWEGIHARIVHGERLTLGVVELDANGVVPEHAHEHEQLGLCLAGSLVFRVGEESRELGPGETWCIPSNVPHEVHVGPHGAVVIDVFVPARDDWREAPLAEARAPRWPER
jgi:quercetin dioxygenase-like cupin family protein